VGFGWRGGRGAKPLVSTRRRYPVPARARPKRRAGRICETGRRRDAAAARRPCGWFAIGLPSRPAGSKGKHEQTEAAFGIAMIKSAYEKTPRRKQAAPFSAARAFGIVLPRKTPADERPSECKLTGVNGSEWPAARTPRRPDRSEGSHGDPHRRARNAVKEIAERRAFFTSDQVHVALKRASSRPPMIAKTSHAIQPPCSDRANARIAYQKGATPKSTKF